MFVIPSWRSPIRLATLTATVSLILLLLVPAVSSATSSKRSAAPMRSHHPCSSARVGLRFYQAATHRWETERGAGLTRVGSAVSSPGCSYVRWAASLWQHRARIARRHFVLWFRAMYAKYECIHLREGSWSDRGLPYMGGLQMDSGFQRTYGAEFLAAWGDAGRWPVWAQLLAAERAFHGYHGYRARGFGPWPTACS